MGRYPELPTSTCPGVVDVVTIAFTVTGLVTRALTEIDWEVLAVDQLVLPGSLKSMTQVPTPVKLTTPLLLNEQPVEEVSRLIATVFPEVEVAVGV